MWKKNKEHQADKESGQKRSLAETWKQWRTKRRRNARGGKWILLAGIGLVAVIGGALLWQNQGRKAKTAAGADTVRTGQVTRGTLVSELTSSGTISPKDTYEITSLVEGEIVSADFEEGDQVTEGQILYQIDVSSMESEVTSANNSLERANSNYQEAQEDYQEALADYSGNTYKSTRTGFIRELKIQTGDKVGSNTELATIYNDQTMKLRVPFLSGEAAAIGAGAQAVVTLTDTQEQLTGVVTSVSNMDEVLSGGRLVRYVALEVANPGGLTTSHSALVQIGEFVCSEEGTFEPMTDTTMKAGLSGSGNVEVEEVLVHEGDYVTVGTPLFRIRAKDAEDIIRSFKDAVDSAKEKVESAQSKVDSTQDTYENYTITAPISGQVITKTMKAGDNISRSSGTGSTTMAVIYDLSQVTFEMSVDELDVRKVKVGQTVQVTADALEGQTFTGKVTNVSLESTQSNGVTNYPVTVTLDQVGDLLPGMNVDGTIILDQVDDTLMIPIDALLRGNRVYVKDSDGSGAQVAGAPEAGKPGEGESGEGAQTGGESQKAAGKQGDIPEGFHAVQVETGLTSDSYVQILSGLNEGDVVYVDQSSQDTSMMFQMGAPGGMGGPGMGGGGPAMGGAPSGGGQRSGGRNGG